MANGDHCAVVSVSDEGIGMSPEDQMHIFEPFRRSKATRETILGVGLGLSVSRRIVQAHGGFMEVESEEGSGSTFRIVFPWEEEFHTHVRAS